MITATLDMPRCSGTMPVRFELHNQIQRRIVFGNPDFGAEPNVTLFGVDQVVAGLAVIEHHNVWKPQYCSHFMRRHDWRDHYSIEPTPRAKKVILDWATITAPRLAEQHHDQFKPSTYDLDATTTDITAVTERLAALKTLREIQTLLNDVDNVRYDNRNAGARIAWETPAAGGTTTQWGPRRTGTVVATGYHGAAPLAYIVATDGTTPVAVPIELAEHL